MRGTEVIALFEKYGLSAHDIVSAVYDGLYPDYFGTRLKPFNCLTCEYAEPGKRPNDPSVCRNQCERQAVAGISYCPHSPGGAPNAMIPEDGIEGTCKYGYVVLSDIDFFERLKGCEFVRAEVEEYLDDLIPGRHRLPIDPRPFDATITLPVAARVEDQESMEPSQAATPKVYAEQRLSQGAPPGQVMLELVERYEKKNMPQWKAAGLSLRKPILDLSEFEKDNLKSAFQRRTKKFK